MTTVHDFTCDRLNGKAEDLSTYKGKVLLVVNTASKCGFTPQFEGLEVLYKDLKDKGLVILGFPCNQFGKQDPGSNDEIGDFCQINYGVSFLASWIVENEVNRGSLTRIQVGSRKINREWGICYANEKKLSITEETFLGICESVAHTMPMAQG